MKNRKGTLRLSDIVVTSEMLDDKSNHNIKNTSFEDKSKHSYVYITLIASLIVLGAIAIGVGIFSFIFFEKEKSILRVEQEYLKALVTKVNESPNVRWKAKFNTFGMKKRNYDYKTLKNVTAVKHYANKIQEFFNSELMTQHLQELNEFSSNNLPRNFDSRQKWSNCPSLHHVFNQGGCGSCYAVAAIAVASDRSCIQSNGTFKSLLSVEDVLNCCQVCGNCYGGDPIKALTYWALEGIVTGGPDGCRPYSVKKDCGTPCLPSEYPQAEKQRKCINKCQTNYYKNSFKNDKHTEFNSLGSIVYTLYPRKMTLDQAGNEKILIPSVIEYFNKTAKAPLNVNEIRNIIRKELYLYGPTTLAIPLTEEFLHYDSGIFHPFPEENFSKRIIYWHVVRLIGWGHDEQDRLHWIAVNSFGNEWGENGLFRIDPTLLESFGLEFETGLL